jgi:ABC-type nickel/cobalt efflux system permease component RcnA
MAEHHHHRGDSQKHTHGEDQKPHWRRLHKDWRLWVAVGLMLTAVLIYVLTLDEASLSFALGKG